MGAADPVGASSVGGASTTANAMGGSGGTDPWAGPIESLVELDLGVHNVGTTQHFDLPNNMIGLTELSETPESGFIGIASLRPPTGGSVIYNFAIPGVGLGAFADELVVSGANPQSDLTQAWPVQEGSWQLRIESDAGGPETVHSRVFVRRTNDGAFHGGVIDFHVYLTPSGADQPYINNVLGQMFASYYTPFVGLTLGTVSFSNIGNQYSQIDSHEEFRQLLATSTAASAPAVNLFVVGDFDGDANGALGIAGGIPGSPMVHGTRRSGVAYAPTFNAQYDASVLAHEIGHLAGLFHTTETVGTVFDPLGDTVECPNIANQNPDQCPDVSNVMFPIAYAGSQMTALQVRVIQGSAIYRGILQEGGAPSGPLVSPLLPQQNAEALASFARSPPGAMRARSAVERALEAVWCARAGDAEALIWEQTVKGDRDVLARIAADGSAFDLARARALGMLARFSATDAEDEAVLSLARHALRASSSARQLNLSALEVVARLAPAELPLLTRSLADPLVVTRAARVAE